MAAVTNVEAPLGEALEPRLYLDPELLEAEQERIFERTWQLIGHVSALPRPGQLHDRVRRLAAGAGRARRGEPACARTATSAATAARAC